MRRYGGTVAHKSKKNLKGSANNSYFMLQYFQDFCFTCSGQA